MRNRLDHAPEEHRGWEWRHFERMSEPSLRTFRGHTHMVNAVALSQDGSLLASGARDLTVRIWSMQSGRGGHGPRRPRGHSARGGVQPERRNCRVRWQRRVGPGVERERRHGRGDRRGRRGRHRTGAQPGRPLASRQRHRTVRECTTAEAARRTTSPTLGPAASRSIRVAIESRPGRRTARFASGTGRRPASPVSLPATTVSCVRSPSIRLARAS